jgi:hypothetical protein
MMAKSPHAAPGFQINKRENIAVTHASVQQAIQTLQAAGQPISVRKVNRIMRATPPYFGMSFRDLLPFLRHSHVTGKECYQQVLELIDALEAELSHPSETMPALLIRAEKTGKTCVPRLQAATIATDGATAKLIWPFAAQQFRYILATASEAIRG